MSKFSTRYYNTRYQHEKKKFVDIDTNKSTVKFKIKEHKLITGTCQATGQLGMYQTDKARTFL